MDKIPIFMDEPTISEIYRETRFRTPSPAELMLGWWVDRIGSGASGSDRAGYRLLGQFAAVGVEQGHGMFESRTTGMKQVGAGDVLLLFPDEPVRYNPQNQWFTRWIVWNGPAAHQTWQAGYADPSHPIVHNAAERVADTYHRLAPILAREDLAAAMERQGVVLHLLAELVEQRESYRLPSRSREICREAMEFIRRHCAEPVSMDKLARRLGLSSTHFRRLFKEQVGRSPQAFLGDMRTARAREMLAQGHTIKETAAELGFSDVGYFMRLFKQKTGQTAGEFVQTLH